MDRKGVTRSIERVYATGDGEIDCDTLQAQLASYVQSEISGGNQAARFPAVEAHLKQCPDCAEEYRALKQVAQLEARNALPQAGELLAEFQAEATPEADQSIGVSSARG